MTAAERARETRQKWLAEHNHHGELHLGEESPCAMSLEGHIERALLAHEAEVRRDEREACARLFEGTSGFLNWLCLDHGGEEAEKIAAMIRDSGREKERA